MTISILAIGSELLDGRVLDTNSQFIAEELGKIGLCLDKILTCDDVESEIISSLTFLSRTSSCIIVSGGLGPTTDDVTRESIAKFFSLPLEQRPDSLTRLRDLYAARKRNLDSSNDKQTFFPKGSEVILNANGTAEGFYIKSDSLSVFSVPGVPKELIPMFHESILPKIREQHKTTGTIHRAPLKIFGLPESLVGAKIQALNLAPSVTISYRATFPEIHVVLKTTDSSALQHSLPLVKTAIGEEFIFIEDEQSNFIEVVSKLILSKGCTISVAESCTGGLLGGALTSMAGSSKYFSGGVLSYSNEMKVALLGVSPDTLKKHGAVSFATASEMACGVRTRAQTDFGISITGIAGPEGGSEEKPVGTFYVGFSSQKFDGAYQFFFKSDRAGVRKFATYAALDVLRRHLLGYPVWDYSSQTHRAPASE